MTHPEYQKRLFPHWTTIPIRFRDLDPLNHVNNAIFSTYYEEARITFIRQVPKIARELDRGFSFVLAELRLQFVSPGVYPADLLVGSGIKSIGNTSISSFQAIYTKQEKKLISVAEAHGVWFNVGKQRPHRLPDLEETEDLFLSDALFE